MQSYQNTDGARFTTLCKLRTIWKIKERRDKETMVQGEKISSRLRGHQICKHTCWHYSPKAKSCAL